MVIDSSASPALVPPTTTPRAYASAIAASAGDSAMTFIAVAWFPPKK